MRLEMISDSDIEELVRIDQECFDKGQAYDSGFFSKLLSGNHISIKALETDEIIGFVIGLMSDTLAIIYTLDVRTQHRRRGVAKNLLDVLERELKEKGCKEIVLQTRVDNIETINLFSNRGYWKTRRISNYYSKGVDAFEMRMTF